MNTTTTRVPLAILGLLIGVAVIAPDAGEMLPPFPAGGLHSELDVARLPGARKLEAGAVPGRSPDVYAFHRQTIQRNLHRIPIR